MIERLTYILHTIDPAINCHICLQPVAQDAVKISCHNGVDCAECMSYWLQSQIQHQHRGSCPRCRNHVDSSNLVVPRGSTEWNDVHDMCWDDEDDEDFDDYDGHDDCDMEEEDQEATSNSAHQTQGDVGATVAAAPAALSNLPPITADQARTSRLAYADKNGPSVEQNQAFYLQHQDVKHRIGPAFLVPPQPVELASVVLIVGRYQAPDGVRELYGFWAYENTTVAEIGCIWYAATYNGELDQWHGVIGGTKTWSFQGTLLDWNTTLGEAGLVSGRTGGTFEIA